MADTTEPTMEEILASIRKIISDEQIVARPENASGASALAGANYAERQSAQAFHAVEPEMEFDAPTTPAQPRAGRVATDILELTESVERARAAQVPDMGRLVSDEAENAALSRIQNLSEMVVRGPGAENTLEGLVAELLKPMLKSWLDANLPDIVEAVVAREIARISGRAR